MVTSRVKFKEQVVKNQYYPIQNELIRITISPSKGIATKATPITSVAHTWGQVRKILIKDTTIIASQGDLYS